MQGIGVIDRHRLERHTLRFTCDVRRWTMACSASPGLCESLHQFSLGVSVAQRMSTIGGTCHLESCDVQRSDSIATMKPVALRSFVEVFSWLLKPWIRDCGTTPAAEAASFCHFLAASAFSERFTCSGSSYGRDAYR